MESAFAELPLAVFTTLAPIGAAGFVALAMIACATEYADGVEQRANKAALASFVVALVGFGASAFHLANPIAAFGAIAGIGRSPLTNEIVVGGVFMAAALVYVVLARAGKLGAANRPFAAVVAVLAVVFCAFVGLAYMVPTVQSWDSVLLPIEVVGYALVGGCTLGMLALAGEADGPAKVGELLRVAAVAGAAITIAAVAIQLIALAGASTAVANGAQIASTVAPFAVAGLVLIAVAAIELWRGFVRGATCAIAVRAFIETVVGVFLVRLAFYAMYMSVGVTLL